MTVSYTSLVHGLDVRTCDLVVAGRAFAELEPAFDAIAEIQTLRHTFASRAARSANLPAALQVPVEVWDMVKQFMIDSSVMATRRAVQHELSCGECEKRRVDRLVAAQPGTDEDEYEVEGFVTAQVRAGTESLQDSVVYSSEWVDCDDCLGHLSAATRYSNTRAAGLNSKSLGRLLANHGLFLPAPTSKGISRPLVKSSFTTTLALQLTRKMAHQLRSAFEFSPLTFCLGRYDPGPLEDSMPPSKLRLGPRVNDDGSLMQFLRKWHFGSPTMVIGPAGFLPGPALGGGLALVGGEPARPRWIVAASDED